MVEKLCFTQLKTSDLGAHILSCLLGFFYKSKRKILQVSLKHINKLDTNGVLKPTLWR